jgi:hypothetical protein
MKPLASAVTESRVLGGILLLGSLGCAAWALMQGDMKRPAIALLGSAIICGTIMYWFGPRRLVSEIVARAPGLASGDREPPWRTRRRVALRALFMIALFAGYAWVIDEPSFGSGLLAGFGSPELIAAIRLRRWERRHGVRVLHEPRWDRLHGATNPQDFYVVRKARA